MLYYDLKKTLLNKKSLCLICLLLIFQFVLFVTVQQSSSIYQKDYQTLQENIKGMPLSDAADYLKKMELQSKLNGDRISDQEWKEAVSQYGNDVLSQLGKETYDLRTIQRLQDEVNYLIRYPAYYQSIVQNQKEEISLFRKDNHFIKERQVAIKKRYEGKKLEAGTSTKGTYGIELILNDYFVDIFIAVFMIYITYIQVDKEYQSGRMSYIKATSKGGLWNYLSKYASLTISMIVFMALSYLGMYVIRGIQYGFVNIQQPIQSVMMCATTPIKCTIIQFLLLMLIMRILAFAFVEMLLLGVSTFFRKTMIGSGLIAICVCISTLLSNFTADKNSLLAYLSLSHILHPELDFIRVSYISIFSHAIYYTWLLICLALLICLIFAGSYYAYITKEYKQKMIEIPVYDKHFHSLLFYEAKKSWLKGAGVLFACLLLMLVSFDLSNIHTLSYQDDRIINYYIDEFGASPTKETYQNIEKEKQRFADIEQKLLLSNNETEKTLLSKELSTQRTFQEYCQKIEMIKNDESRQVLKEDHTRMFFDQSKEFAKLLVFYILMMVLMCMHTYAKEKESGVTLYYKTTMIGIRKTHTLKYIQLSVGFTLLWCFISIMIFLHNKQMYPDVMLNVAMHDLQQFFTSPFTMTIMQYLVMQFILEILVIQALLYCVLYLFSRIKSEKVTAIVLFLLLSVPLLLCINEVYQAPLFMCLFYPFLNIKKAFIAYIFILIVFILCRIKKVRDIHA
ncbi:MULTISPECIES: hypothetical protein [Bacillota]|uniref:Uncharacterized protein n=3 Tax=Erysipelotrichales TaxID=526525 RepID=A0A7G9GTD8_9FIRM|nr:MULTISPECIES: hypothetical protein [Bacillota]MCH4285802.1 hypothetical protein [Amedibacillus hominis]QNM14070.1 hypothetical protein H9Q80_09080 [[Eubacterium] hominis]